MRSNSEQKRALITGIRGQDGWFLSQELATSGRTVLGTGRTPGGAENYRHVDYVDRASLRSVLDEFRPHEIYHLACPSQLKDSEEFERDVLDLSTTTVLTFLRWIVERSPQTRFFFAGSSEIFGDPVLSPQNELCPPRPAHAYAIAKLAGQNLTAAFRVGKSVFACTGILFNHESHLRREEFVSRRITSGVAEIASGRTARLPVGNLDAVRDWSHAADFARGFRLALEAGEARDYVFASGKKRTVREFCDVAFAAAGLDAANYLSVDPVRFREDFANPRVGDPELAWQCLGWRANRDFEDWVGEMVRSDLKRISGGR